MVAAVRETNAFLTIVITIRTTRKIQYWSTHFLRESCSLIASGNGSRRWNVSANADWCCQHRKVSTLLTNTQIEQRSESMGSGGGWEIIFAEEPPVFWMYSRKLRETNNVDRKETTSPEEKCANRSVWADDVSMSWEKVHNHAPYFTAKNAKIDCGMYFKKGLKSHTTVEKHWEMKEGLMSRTCNCYTSLFVYVYEFVRENVYNLMVL